MFLRVLLGFSAEADVEEEVSFLRLQSVLVPPPGRTSHGGLQRDAVHGDHAPRLQDGEGAQPELCHPAVHQRLPTGGQGRPPQGHHGEEHVHEAPEPSTRFLSVGPLLAGLIQVTKSD